MLKKYCAIGEALQKIQLFKPHTDVLSMLKWNWGKIFDPSFTPIQYSKGNHILILGTASPVIYVEHLSKEIMTKCNSFLGFEAVKKIKFVQA